MAAWWAGPAGAWSSPPGCRWLPSSCPRSAKDRILRQLAFQARRRAMPGIQRRGERQLQQLGADAHHLAAQVRLRRLLADAAGEDRVADEGMVGDDVADAARRVAWRVHDRDLELAELELVAVEEVTVGGPKELLGVQGVQRGLPAGQLLHLVLAGDVAGVAVGGDDPAHGHAPELLGDLVCRQAGVDDHGLLGRGARDDVRVDLALELDLDDSELGHQLRSPLNRMQQIAVVTFGVVLLGICVFWIYGYFRRRSKKRF